MYLCGFQKIFSLWNPYKMNVEIYGHSKFSLSYTAAISFLSKVRAKSG